MSVIPETVLDAHREAYVTKAVCVTGGAGFIGSHLCEALVDLGASVTIIDDLSNGRIENIAGFADRVRFIEGSVLDATSVADAVDGASVVFHQAALGSVPRSVQMPLEYLQANTLGTGLVLDAARRNSSRVVYAASSSAYGDQPSLPKTKTMCPDPRSPYAASKLAGEHLVRSYALCYQMHAVCLRYFNIFGPRQRSDSTYAAVIPRWIESLFQGEQPIVYGDGLQTRDFTYVANAVHANLLAGGADASLQGQVVNIGCGARYSLLQLLETIALSIGHSAEPVLEPARTGDVRDSEASIEAAAALIGYEPIVSFQDGIVSTVDSMRPAAT